MLVSGAGEGFNLIVPIRRMQKWCQDVNLLWAIDESIPCPSLEEIKTIQSEDAALEANLKTEAKPVPADFDVRLANFYNNFVKEEQFPFRIHRKGIITNE